MLTMHYEKANKRKRPRQFAVYNIQFYATKWKLLGNEMMTGYTCGRISPSALLVSSSWVCGEGHKNRCVLIWAFGRKRSNFQTWPKLLWFYVASVSSKSYQRPTVHINLNYNPRYFLTQDAKTKADFGWTLWRQREKEGDEIRTDFWSDEACSPFWSYLTHHIS